MTATTTVKCDHCGSDLSAADGFLAYRLVLQAEPIPTVGSSVMRTVMVYPPIQNTHHYCGTGCLSAWLDARKGR